MERGESQIVSECARAFRGWLGIATCVLFQYAANAQADWRALNPGVLVPPSWGCELADFPPTQQVVAYGGFRGGTTGETWAWNGLAWTQWTAAPQPSPRGGAALAFDEVRGKLILFGGSAPSLNQPLDETWEWDGFAWRLIATMQRPSARVGAAMAFDVITNRMILFGGQGVTGELGDTWALDGSGWSQLSPAHAPTPRDSHRMATDRGRGRIVLFGGNPPSRPHWEWTGVDWVEIGTVGGPGPRYSGHRLAYDPIRGRIVLHGGIPVNNAPVSAETWEWDGAAWQLRCDGTSGPGRRAFFGMCYSSRDGATLLFGGASSSSTWHTDQWAWQSPRLASYATAARGCPARSGESRLLSPSGGPWSADAFDVFLDPGPYLPTAAIMLTGFSTSAWGGVSLPHALDPYGLSGCQIAVSADVNYPMTWTLGGFRWGLQIPAATSLGGMRFYNQAIVLAPGVSPANAVMTSASEAVIGVR